MPWLVRGDEVLASLEIADSFRSRLVGLLGRDSLQGALLIPRARSVHTIGMRFAIDVAYCDADLVVLRTVRLRRNRVDRPVLRARCALEVPAGALERWSVGPGDQLEIKGAP